MPMTFADEDVEKELEMRELDQSGTPQEKRERLAEHIENVFQDHLAAWEIRSGKPWNEMTYSDAARLVQDKPEMLGNPGVASRLMPGVK